MTEVQNIGDINEIKELTPEEKLEKKPAYQREYMKKRRATDAKFSAKEREANRER